MIKWTQEENRYYNYASIPLHRLFELARSAQAKSTRMPNYARLLSDIFCSISQQISMLNRIQYLSPPSESEVRGELLSRTVEVLSFTPVEALKTVPVAQFFAVAALRLNTHLLANFETADTALSALFDDRPVDGVEHRRTRLEDLSPRCLVILGLTGIIEASMDSSCAGEFDPGKISVVFERLEQLKITWGGSQSFAPLVSKGGLDLCRYAVETMFSFYNKKSASDGTASLPSEVRVLFMLHSKWDDVSGIAEELCTQLIGSSDQEIRKATAAFLSLNSDSVGRHPQVHNILYEMLRMSRHEPLSYFESDHCRYLRHTTISFQSIAKLNGNDSMGMEAAVDSLLERLINNDLLGTLMLSAYAADMLQLRHNNFQGIPPGRTIRYWGDRVIAIAQKSKREGSAVADRIREFCDSLDDFIDDTNDSDKLEEADNVKDISYLAQREREFMEGRRRLLSELKRAFLPETGMWL